VKGEEERKAERKEQEKKKTKKQEKRKQNKNNNKHTKKEGEIPSWTTTRRMGRCLQPSTTPGKALPPHFCFFWIYFPCMQNVHSTRTYKYIKYKEIVSKLYKIHINISFLSLLFLYFISR